MAFITNTNKADNNNLLLVVDGSSIVTTCFYGGVPIYIQREKDVDKANALCRKELRQNKDGVYTNAVAPSIAMILALIRFYHPTHVAVCFDKSSKTTFRKRMYPDYKANRAQKPDAIKEQVATTREILKNIGIPAFWSDKYEADDIAGSIITQFKNDCNKVLFVTKDHDWLQLIDHNVFGIMMMASEEKAQEMRDTYAKYVPENDDVKNMWHPKTFRKCVTFDANVTFAEDGVYPKQIMELKGLSGDSSDNIPGVKGIGPTTTIPLLQYYHSIDGIYAAIDKCKIKKGNSVFALSITDYDKGLLDQLALDMKNHGISRNPIPKLIAGREDALMSRELATIVTDIKIPFSLSSLTHRIDKEKLQKAIDYYELDEFQYLVDPEL